MNEGKKKPAAIDSSGYKSALDTLFCSAIIISNDGDIVYMNRSAEMLLQKNGLENGKLIRRLGEEIDFSRGKGRFQFDLPGYSVICNVYPWMDGSVRRGSVLILHQSMQENCQAQEAECNYRMTQEISALIEFSHDGIMVTDNEGTVIRTNAASEKVLMTDKRALLGMNVDELVDLRIVDQFPAMDAIRTRKPSTMIVYANSNKLMVTASPVFDSGGSISTVIINLRDIGELEKLRIDMERQKLLAEGYLHELTSLGRGDSGIISASPQMKKILGVVQTISHADSTVLVTGESGVGKEIIVRQIHNTSRRHDKPFIKLNCGAIPPSLFESELFGYEDGAFTGARRKGKPGYFELADGGTLFLDEVSELQPELQVKLLRAIQEGEIMRVGGTDPISVDVRIVAATNRNLKSMVENGTFRQDLYYRLNVIAIEIPPLCRRREDIIPLAQHFLNTFNKKLGVHKEFSTELCRALQGFSWPGNVRELENVIESMVVLCTGSIITPDCLPESYLAKARTPSRVSIRGVMPLKEMLAEAESQLLRNAQARYSTTTEIAKALGVNQSTISRKLCKLSAEPDAE